MRQSGKSLTYERSVNVNRRKLKQISLENLLKRSPNSYGKFESQVAEIIENVRAKKMTLHYLTIPRSFDGADISADNILVTEAEIKEAYENVDTKLVRCYQKGTGQHPYLP